MPFKPFSLAESIQAGQAIKMNQLKIQAAESEMSRQQQLRGLAQMATKPTYESYEQPEEQSFPGEAPIPGLQQQGPDVYSPEVHAERLSAAGEPEMAAKMQDQIAQMSKAQREEATYRAGEMGKMAFTADTPEKWEAIMPQAIEQGFTDKPVPFEMREQIINQARSVEDMLKFSPVKAPKQRTRRDGREIVNEEWNATTQGWEEVGRGPMSQQNINLRSKPSEVAAGKEFDRILDQANTAEGQLINIDRAKALVPDIDEGKLEPMKLWAREWGDALGIPIDTEKMSDAVSFRATMKNAVLDGMKSIKGTASEADRKTVEDSVAALDNPEDANRFLLDTAESLAKRTIDRADFYDSWAKENGGSLLGVRRAWSKRVNSVPLLKRVGTKVHHFYQFKEQVIQLNKAAFANATREEIDAEVERQWKEGR